MSDMIFFNTPMATSNFFCNFAFGQKRNNIIKNTKNQLYKWKKYCEWKG